MRKSEKAKFNKKYVVIVPMVLVCGLLVVSWARESLKKEDSISVENSQVSSVVVDWDKVNKAIDSYDFASNGYYLESEYKENEKEWNYVMVTNYDDSRLDGFKEVEYQLSITYGECSEMNEVGNEAIVYDEAMIEISLLDNSGNGEYAVIYKLNGEVVETFGEWFLSDKQEDYLQKVLNDSYEMFGL